jgi:6-phosphofructokinase 1
VAGGATGVLVPELDDELPGLIIRIGRQMARGKRTHLNVVAEGDQAGGALPVAKEVAERLGQPFRIVVLGHVQRGGRPTARDRIVASVSGASAVECLVEGRSGYMIGIQSGKPVEVPLAEVVAHQHPPPSMDLVSLAERIAG